MCLFFVNYFSKIIVWWLAIIGTIEFFHGVVIFCQLAFKRAGQSVDWISTHWVCMWICSNPLGWCGLLCPKMNGSNKWLCTALRFCKLQNRHAPTLVGTTIISMALTLVGLDIGMLGHCYGLDICMAQTLVWLWHWYGSDISMLRHGYTTARVFVLNYILGCKAWFRMQSSIIPPE